MKKIFPIVLLLSGCSSAPILVKSIPSEEVEQCKTAWTKYNEIETIKNENKDKDFEKSLNEYKTQYKTSVNFLSKHCAENLKWNYVKNNQDKEMLVIKSRNSEFNENDELVSEEIISSEIINIISNFDYLITKGNEIKSVKNLKNEKESRTYSCSSGEKKFVTKIKLDTRESENDIELSAFLYVEEADKKKKFDLNLDLDLVGIDLSERNGNNFSFPEDYLAKDKSEDHIEAKKKLIAASQKIKSENGFFNFPAILKLSTDSGCTTKQDLTLKIHEKKINEYKQEVSQYDTKNQYYESCLKESKEKLIQQLFAQSSICKINACIKKFNEWGNKEREIAARTGFVNKLIVRAVGEYIQHYEGRRKTYSSVLSKIGSLSSCPSDFNVKSATIFGNDRSGYMCFVDINLKKSNLSDCARSLIGISENGSVSNQIPYSSNLSNGLLDFSGEVVRFARQKEEKTKSKIEDKALDPDEQMKKDSENNIQFSLFELIGPEGTFVIVDQNNYEEESNDDD